MSAWRRCAERFPCLTCLAKVKYDTESRLRQFKYLGGNRVQVTYEWLVNDSLDQDYHCFVHGLHKDSAHPQGIDFQQDHTLPKPHAGLGSLQRGDCLSIS